MPRHAACGRSGRSSHRSSPRPSRRRAGSRLRRLRHIRADDSRRLRLPARRHRRRFPDDVAALVPAVERLDRGPDPAFEADIRRSTSTFEIVPFEEYNQKILTALAGGRGPPLFEADDYTFPQFTEDGVFAPIHPAALGFAARRPDCGIHRQLARPGHRRGRDFTGHPLRPGGSGRGYNLGLLAAAGVDPASPTTWDEVMAAAGTMTDRRRRPAHAERLLVRPHIDVYYQFQGTTLFEQAGAGCSTEDGTAAAINSPEAHRVFEFWRDVVHKYGVTEPGFTSTFYTDEFGKNRVAMGWMYVWANSILAPRATRTAWTSTSRSADVRQYGAPSRRTPGTGPSTPRPAATS